MPNVTLPEKDGRGQQQGWLRVDKKVHQKMWQFGLKNPTGLAVLHFLTSRFAPWNKRRRHELCSNGRSHGDCRQDGENRCCCACGRPFHSDPQIRQVERLHHQFAGGMAGRKRARFAAFNSEIVLAEQEQIVPVDKLIEDAKELVTVPLLEPGERFLVGNEDTPPPDQLEMHLP